MLNSWHILLISSTFSFILDLKNRRGKAHSASKIFQSSAKQAHPLINSAKQACTKWTQISQVGCLPELTTCLNKLTSQFCQNVKSPIPVTKEKQLWNREDTIKTS